MPKEAVGEPHGSPSTTQRTVDGDYVARASSPGEDPGNATDADGRAPGGVTVSSVFPNPTSAGATITVRVERARPVTVEVFDALGRRVALVRSGVRRASQTVTAALPDRMAPGTYVVRVTGAHFAESRSLTVVR